jgi:hypothetical protein
MESIPWVLETKNPFSEGELHKRAAMHGITALPLRYSLTSMRFSFREHPVPIENLGMRAEPFA